MVYRVGQGLLWVLCHFRNCAVNRGRLLLNYEQSKTGGALMKHVLVGFWRISSFVLYHVLLKSGIADFCIYDFESSCASRRAPQGVVLTIWRGGDFESSLMPSDEYADHCKARRERSTSVCRSRNLVGIAVNLRRLQFGRSCLILGFLPEFPRSPSFDVIRQYRRCLVYTQVALY